MAPSEPPREPLHFEYWSDPLCIWAYCAEEKLGRILEEWGDALVVDYRIVPVFGSIPRRMEEGSWSAGGPIGRRDATRRVAEQHGRSDIRGELWVRDCPSSSWSSGAAAKAAFLLEAREESPAGSGAAYLWALRRAAFERDLNIARRSVQLEVAESVGLSPSAFGALLNTGLPLAALSEDDDDRKAAGVRGSPTYLFDGGRATLYGNFPFEILHGTVAELLRGLGLGASAC